MEGHGTALVEGLDADRLDRIREYVHDQVSGDAANAPFMQVLVSRNAKVVASFSAGPISLDDATPVGPDTIVRVASMTKPIVSVAAMTLVERAKIMLDHPIERYLPCFQDMQVYVAEGVTRPAATKMTVQHLLTHSSGLTCEPAPSSPQPREQPN